MRHANFGLGWLSLCLALVLHVVDETLTGFLVVYNPTAIAVRERVPWLPVPVFQFEVWLGGLTLACILLLAMSPLAYRGVRWLRPVAYAFAGLMFVNALGHIAGTILGRTLTGLTFSRPMPGFYSSPVLLAASVYLWVQLSAKASRTVIGEPPARATAHAAHGR